MAEQEKLLESAKEKLKAVNWFHVLIILSVFGIGIFALWYVLRKRSSKEAKK